MSKYPKAVVASKYGNRPLIEVPAVSILRQNRSAGDVPAIAPTQYRQPPYSAQQTYANQQSYPTQQPPYVGQQQYVPAVPISMGQQQQYVPPAPHPLPHQQYAPPQQNRNWSNIATNSNLVPHVETVQVPQTQLPYGGMMPNLPSYNTDPVPNTQQYGAPVVPNTQQYGAPVVPNYQSYGTNNPVNNPQNGIVDAKGEIHHFYGPNGTQVAPHMPNLSHAWGGHFQQSNFPTNFVLEGTVEYGKLTSVRLKESTISFRDIPDVLLSEIYRMYKEVKKTKIKVIASRGEYNIYATPYLTALIDEKYEGYVYEPNERYHANYRRKPITRSEEDRYTKRYDRGDIRLATERRNVLNTRYHDSDEENDDDVYPVADNDAKRRWRKLKHAIKVREY